MQPNFGFSEDYSFFHTSNMIRPNFINFLNFPKLDGIDHLRIFKHWAQHVFYATQSRRTTRLCATPSSSVARHGFILTIPYSTGLHHG
jgi:hypothetical protein